MHCKFERIEMTTSEKRVFDSKTSAIEQKVQSQQAFPAIEL